MNEYATHQEILKRVLFLIAPECSIEHGSGDSSTPILASHSKEVVSIETDPEWAKKARRFKNVTVVDHYRFSHLIFFDFALVDGDRHQRSSFAQAAFDSGIPVIMWHDTEPAGMSYYRYDEVIIPDNYHSWQWRHPQGKKKGTRLFARKPIVPDPGRWELKENIYEGSPDH